MITVAHVVLGARMPDGTPPLPETLGPVRVWDRRYAFAIGACPAWEYRDGGDARFVTIQHVADLGDGRAVWIAWVPSDVRGEPAPLLAYLAAPLMDAGVLDAWWPTDADGTIPAVEADPSAAAVLAAWPASWRVRLPTDAPGDLTTPPAPPTSPRCIGEALG